VTITQDQNIIESFSDMISESEIESDIKRLRIASQQSKPVSNMRALKDRIDEDVAAMYQKTHILGFYGTNISYKIHADDPENIMVEIHLDLGAKFKLGLNIRYLNQNEEFNERYAAVLRKDLRAFKASIDEIKSLVAIAVNNLQKNGFFKPEIIEKRVRINYEAQEAVLQLTIDPGQKVSFSDVEIKSFPDIDDNFVRNRILWRKGEMFDIEKVESTAENLKNTQIFSKVKIKPQEEKILNGKVPMIIELQEDKKHIIDFSILYSGMRNMNFEKKSQAQKRLKSIVTRLAWTNFNAFGGGEKLSFAIEATPMRVREKRPEYAFEVALSQPDVFFKNNSVEYYVARKQELTNVFFKKSDHGSITFKYPLLDSLLIRTGGSLEKDYVNASEIFFRNKEDRRKYDNFSIQSEFIVDKTDDWLNPTGGHRLIIKFSEIFFRNSGVGNLKTFDVNFANHYPLDDLKRTVLAFNLSRKSVFGQKIDDIPIDKRIYAGGMNSARGYANQMATEIVVGEDTPMGGKSLLEFNSELRRKVSPDFGCVLFFDGAKVFQNKSRHNYLQTEEKRWFYSVGIGVRYYTSIGPIRADLAFPIKRRRGVDSKVQFIMSLGQAF
jgi:translocation and assembly module TamA